MFRLIVESDTIICPDEKHVMLPGFAVNRIGSHCKHATIQINWLALLIRWRWARTTELTAKIEKETLKLPSDKCGLVWMNWELPKIFWPTNSKDQFPKW